MTIVVAGGCLGRVLDVERRRPKGFRPGGWQLSQRSIEAAGNFLGKNESPLAGTSGLETSVSQNPCFQEIKVN